MSFYVTVCFWFFWCEISESVENGWISDKVRFET